MLSALFFYLFAIICVGAAFMVIAVRNPVHAVLFLILAFFNAAGLFVLLGAEFLAMILVVVYVGAVLVLFLFVVMMLDVDFAVLQRGLHQISADRRYHRSSAPRRADPDRGRLGHGARDRPPQAPTPPAADISNTEAIGLILYTRYVYLFEAAGLILLVAMIGAIVLTLQHKRDVRRQSHRRASRPHPRRGLSNWSRSRSGRGLS